MDTLNKSRLVSLKDINNIPKFQKVIGIVTKTIAPLL